MGEACPGAAAAEDNVALGRRYEVFPTPNYEGALDPGKTVLTDGVSANGSFWKGDQSLGWSGRSPVTIKIGLAAPAPVSHVRIHASAKLSGGAYYPSQFLIFGGDGHGGYGFLGTSALSQDRDTPQDAETRAFDIRFPARAVSEIAVVGFARGLLLYVSEIEVFSADGGRPLP